eukprot:s304_g15.t1
MQDSYYAEDCAIMDAHREIAETQVGHSGTGSGMLQDCYMKELKPCSYPRYRWLDLLYELLFHEQCMLLLMADAGTYGNLDCPCAFSTRLMACAKVAVQCLLLAIGFGAVIVADSRPLGRQFPDEATMLAEARQI